MKTATLIETFYDRVKVVSSGKMIIFDSITKAKQWSQDMDIKITVEHLFGTNNFNERRS